VKLVTIVGARPQFIKASAVSRVIRDGHAGTIDEVVVHTGQHDDQNMSDALFGELDIPAPRHKLDSSGGKTVQRMQNQLERVLHDEAPDRVLVYGDTNSTLAGARAAVRCRVPLAHVEAGVRSFNPHMVEERNRVETDRLSSILFCPTATAVGNLNNEGVVQGIHHVGDVMYDAHLLYRDRARRGRVLMERLGVADGGFVLATCHRAENTDDRARLEAIVSALATISRAMPVVFPMHPRTRKALAGFSLHGHLRGLVVIDPLPYLEMMALEQAARVILTDSGGVQKEAFFHGVPCVTMRDQTEWIETVECGRNILAGANAEAIASATARMASCAREPALPNGNPYGLGDAAEKIAAVLAAPTAAA
jgi:UDP-GlcNAc3NAcA epimerase